MIDVGENYRNRSSFPSRIQLNEKLQRLNPNQNIFTNLGFIVRIESGSAASGSCRANHISKMSIDDVSFIVNYGGKFQTLEDGNVVYNGGFGQDLVTPARSLFQELPVNLYGQRIWYKLPFQDLKELRILCGEDTENFESMCEASKWTTLIEIYMEADEGDNGNDAGDELNEERGS
ncbi:unnamed protein product [Microthlaspi erraticum]|uniref:Uncharacterized protein n=1 Tax=Microthlaspi erraticum TaxID=1685480 RepID=A0A6D2J5F0_9BRAS|nr:unnamed protein product [Microthlaspi erraticum]